MGSPLHNIRYGIQIEAKELEDGTQQAVAQVPQIASPHTLDLAAIRQLPKDGIDERANPPQDTAIVGCCGWRDCARR